MIHGIKTELLLAMSIIATMVYQPLVAQNLIIDKTDCKIGSLEDTVEISYVYKNVEPNKATHAAQTIKQQDTTIIQIINLNTQKVIDEDVYVRDSLIYNRLYNEEGDSVQVTSYKDLSIKHYQQGRLVRQYKYKGNKRVAVLCYPDGPVMCTYTSDADIQYYTRAGEKTKVAKPIRLASDSLLKKALTRMLIEKNANPQEYSIEIKVSAKGNMMGWRNIADNNNTYRKEQSDAIPFAWKPANVDGFELIGYDTISIGEKDFKKLQIKKGLTFPQLPQDGDLFYAGTTQTTFVPFYNPFMLAVDSTRYEWRADVLLEPTSKNNPIATVRHNGNSVYFDWANKDGKKFKEEKYTVQDSHTLLLEEEVYWGHDSIIRINQFTQGDIVSSIRINAKGDTLSVWRDTGERTYSYTYNINPYIQFEFVSKTHTEETIKYRNETKHNIVRPHVKDISKCYIIIPDSLRNINEIITNDKGVDVDINYTFEDLVLYACVMVGEDGTSTSGYKLGFKNKHVWESLPSIYWTYIIYNEKVTFDTRVENLIVQRKKQILQYVQDELSKSPIEFSPAHIGSNVVEQPCLFTLTLVTDSSEIPTSNLNSEDDGVVFLIAEKMPEFIGGSQALYEYLSENIQYPADAKKNHLQGRVLCQFVVDKDGSITDIKVVRSSGHPALDQEAIRLVRSMPLWQPGYQKGKAVRVRFTLPINFQL